MQIKVIGLRRSRSTVNSQHGVPSRLSAVCFIINWRDSGSKEISWSKQVADRRVYLGKLLDWRIRTESVVISQTISMVSQKRLSSEPIYWVRSRHLVSGSTIQVRCVTPHSSPTRGHWPQQPFFTFHHNFTRIIYIVICLLRLIFLKSNWIGWSPPPWGGALGNQNEVMWLEKPYHVTFFF